MRFWFAKKEACRLSEADRALKELVPYDPEAQVPVIRSSICTGEKVAGFKSKETGRFREVMCVRSESDIQRFRAIFGLDIIETEY